MAQFRYDFEKAKIKRARAGKVELRSFVMREIDGRDEEVAAGYVKAKNDNTTVTEEMVRLSIVSVNDQPVPQPYLAFDTWNSRARIFAVKAFNEVNGMTSKEEDDFFGTAEEVDAPLPSSGASASATP